MALASVVRMYFFEKCQKAQNAPKLCESVTLEKGIYVWTIGIDDSKRFGEPNFSEASMMVDSVDFHERFGEGG